MDRPNNLVTVDLGSMPIGWPPGHPHHQVKGCSGWLEKKPSSSQISPSPASRSCSKSLTPKAWKRRWVVISPVGFTTEGVFATMAWYESDTMKGGPKGIMQLASGSSCEATLAKGEFVVYAAPDQRLLLPGDALQSPQQLRLRCCAEREEQEEQTLRTAKWVDSITQVLSTLPVLCAQHASDSSTDLEAKLKNRLLEPQPSIGELGC